MRRGCAGAHFASSRVRCGYPQESGLPGNRARFRNHYVGRTFIEPKQSIRNFGVKVKLNPVREILQGKRIVLVDDSIVRGTTSKKIVKIIRAAGAKEIHMRITSPPIIAPCYYGIDIPTRHELLAYSKSVEEISKFIGADSLGYLSLDAVLQAVGDGKQAPFGMFHRQVSDRHRE